MKKAFPKKAEDWDIARIIEDYADAAERMKDAGHTLWIHEGEDSVPRDRLIAELAPLSKQDRWPKLQQLGDEAIDLEYRGALEHFAGFTRRTPGPGN